MRTWLDPRVQSISKKIALHVVSLEEEARTQDAGFRKKLARLGGRVVESFWIYDGASIELSHAAVLELASDAAIAGLWPDKIVRPARALPAPYRPIEEATGSGNHNSQAAHKLGIRGQKQIVAMIDTGLDSDMNGKGRPHAAYYPSGDPSKKTGGGIGGSRLLALTKIGSKGPDDVSGHGTAVSGVIAAGKWNTLRGTGDGHAPEAKIVGYSIANTATGESDYTTMIRAFQRIVPDKGKYGFRCLNFSYLGDPRPTHPSQQALDNLTRIGDLLTTTPAGNNEASTLFSQSNANGLAVGAVHTNTRRVAAFSSRGPIFGDPLRFFPDLCANGVGVQLPKLDDESTNYATIGTSMAAPQVCGSGVLFRQKKPSASALETKAAILASLEDVSAHNTKAPFATRNAYGLGYLRIDALIALASGRGLLAKGALSAATKKRSFSFAVKAGRKYSVVATWHRHVVSSKTWSDFRLTVRAGTSVIASSDSLRNLYERCSFTAAATRTLQIEVEAKTLESIVVPFGLAAAETTRPFELGSISRFGTSCPGTGTGNGIGLVLPEVYRDRFAPLYGPSPLGYLNHHYMQVFDSSRLTKTQKFLGIAFRHDESEVYRNIPYEVDFELSLGESKLAPKQMSKRFADNVFGSLTKVIARRKIQLPILREANTSPHNFSIVLKFDRPYTFTPTLGRYLVMDAVRHSSSIGNSFVYFMVDAAQDQKNYPFSGLFSENLSSATGTLSPGAGAITGFVTSNGVGKSYPTLSYRGMPSIGRFFRLQVDGALPQSIGLVVFGVSKTKWLWVNLPIGFSSLGAPGCTWYVSGEYMHPMLFSAKGSAGVEFYVPPDLSWIGRSIYEQGFLLDTKANKLGAVLTGGLQSKIGGQKL